MIVILMLDHQEMYWSSFEFKNFSFCSELISETPMFIGMYLVGIFGHLKGIYTWENSKNLSHYIHNDGQLSTSATQDTCL